MRPASSLLTRRIIGCLTALVLTACAAPPLQLRAPADASRGTTFSIDADAAVSALASKPNRLWQDSSMNAPRVRDALKARGAKAYSLDAAGVTWTNALGGPSSSAPAYAKVDYQNTTGPLPVAGDFVYVISDVGQIQRIDPTTQAKTTANLGVAFSKSAVMVSGDNRRVYLMSSNGTFFILDAVTLATIWSAKISNAGFVGMAPFIDYSNGGGFPLGSDERVMCLSTDGSLYMVNVKRGAGGVVTQTVAAWTSSNGVDQAAALPAWTTKVNIPFGVAVVPGSTPVCWGGRAYWGTTTGTFYRVAVNPLAPLAVPTLTSWNLAQYTSAPAPNGMACSAPPALDYDNALTVTAIFAPCGDRLCYIDVASGTVYPSPPLVADKVPGAPAQYQGALSSFPYTTVTNSYTSFDWDCVAATNLYTPTRWGSGGATAIFGTPVNCTTIKRDPIGGNMWAGQYVATPNGNVQGLTPAGSVVFTTQSNTPRVNEIAFDDTGNCFAAHGGGTALAKFNNAGTLVGSFTYPGGKSAGWPQPDHTGAVWCTSMSPGFLPGGGNNVTKFNAAGTVLFTNALANAFSIAVDSANNAYVTTSSSPATVTKYNSAGAVQAGWPITVGNFASYVAIEPGTNNIWVTNYSSNTVSKLSPLGATLGTYATPAGPWAIAFDINGLPWVSCIGATNVNKMSLTGSVLATYAIPGGGQPFELAFDGAGACWVSCSNGTYKIFDLGNLSDLFATDGFGAPGDGDDSLAALKFKIPKAAFAGKPAVSSNLQVTTATTPSIGPVETLDLYSLDNVLNATATLWLGWQTPASINMDYNNRAAINNGGQPVSTLAAITPIKDTNQTFMITSFLPTDAINTSDLANSWHTYAFNATGKALVNAAHWYSNTTAPGAAQRPTLNVKTTTTADPSTNGIQCQPLVDTDFGRIYVLACNCVFELPYAAATPDDIRNSSKIFYNLTKAGRTGGPLSGGKFLYPLGNMQQNFYGDLFVVDQDAVSGKMYANRFNRKFFATPAVDHLAAFFDAAPAAGILGQAMIWDYDKGSVYFTSSNNMLVRGTLY
ncbi:MAG: hypothetical protein JWM80_25 [Cyanobacteria bacterium RYN_339]|nr:hypothetical protein [Cyanobacteria bacterium RYN_339]